MDKEEQVLREKAIQRYLGDCELEILDNIEVMEKKREKLIAKLF